MKGMKVIILIAVAGILLVAAPAFAGEPVAKEMEVLKTSTRDNRAIVKTPYGDTRIVKPGDVILGNIKVIDIAEDGVVFDEQTISGVERVVVKVEDRKDKDKRSMRSRGRSRPPDMIKQDNGG